jgi:hexosaminidase
VEYMVFPRMLALSEVVWSPRETRDFGGFVERLSWHFDRFEALGVNYRPLDR